MEAINNIAITTSSLRPEAMDILKPYIRSAGLRDDDFLQRIHDGLNTKKKFTNTNKHFFLTLFDNKAANAAFTGAVTFLALTSPIRYAISLFCAGMLGYARAAYMHKLEVEAKQAQIKSDVNQTTILHRQQTLAV